MPVPRPYNPDPNRVAELIQADLAKVGIDVEIVSYGMGEFLRRSKSVKRDGAVLFGRTGTSSDPDGLLSALLGCDAVGGSNLAQWCNDEFEALLKAARTATSPPERKRLYAEAQAVFDDEAPWATLAHAVAFVPMSSKVTGYVMDPLGGHWFDGVDITE